MAEAAKPPVPGMAPEVLSSADRRRLLVEWLIDQWGEQSFPASDPPSRLPPSLSNRPNDLDEYVPEGLRPKTSSA